MTTLINPSSPVAKEFMIGDAHAGVAKNFPSDLEQSLYEIHPGHRYCIDNHLPSNRLNFTQLFNKYKFQLKNNYSNAITAFEEQKIWHEHSTLKNEKETVTWSLFRKMAFYPMLCQALLIPAMMPSECERYRLSDLIDSEISTDEKFRIIKEVVLPLTICAAFYITALYSMSRAVKYLLTDQWGDLNCRAKEAQTTCKQTEGSLRAFVAEVKTLQNKYN